jgi:hypothetical protein
MCVYVHLCVYWLNFKQPFLFVALTPEARIETNVLVNTGGVRKKTTLKLLTTIVVGMYICVCNGFVTFAPTAIAQLSTKFITYSRHTQCTIVTYGCYYWIYYIIFINI